MARYRVYIADAARKELRKLGKSTATEILSHVEKKLTSEPHAFGRPLTGDLIGYYRLRVAGCRVVYRIIDEEVWVCVLAVGKREEGNADNIYDWLTGETLETRLQQLLKEIEEQEEDEED
jgi:mRNA interferase RelE/StbE